MLWAALLALQGMLPIAIVYVTRSLVNAVVAAVRSSADTRPALLLMAWMAGLLLLAEAARAGAGWIRTVQPDLVQDHINQLIHRKSFSVVAAAVPPAADGPDRIRHHAPIHDRDDRRHY